MRNIKSRIVKAEKKTNSEESGAGIVIMLKDGRYESGGKIYERVEDLPKFKVNRIFLPERMKNES